MKNVTSEYLLPRVRCECERVRIRTGCVRMRNLQQESYGGYQYADKITLRNRIRTTFREFEKILIADWQ